MSAEEVGVGQCPKRAEGLGHVWAGALASGNPRNPCKFCGRPGRDNAKLGESGGFFGEATAARSELFSRLKQPASVKAWGKS